jgi:nucleotide-binding universal stress UspA family protein
MAYKDILVHLDSTARSDVRLGIAAELAERADAHLTGLYTMELPPLSLFMGETSVFDMQMATEIMQQARERAEAIANTVQGRFDNTLRKYGIAGEWRSVDGVPETVALHARYADIAIVGQTDPDRPGMRVVPETVILESGRPVLVIPYVGNIEPIGNKVLVGWKSGREAARAVNDALPLLSRAKSVTVLAIDPQDGITEEGAVPAADITVHLARHGITATAAHTISGGIGEGDVLLNYVSDMGADLIVVGGYGHSRAREFVLGGATRSLLTEMTVPVLFSH